MPPPLLCPWVPAAVSRQFLSSCVSLHRSPRVELVTTDYGLARCFFGFPTFFALGRFVAVLSAAVVRALVAGDFVGIKFVDVAFHLRQRSVVVPSLLDFFSLSVNDVDFFRLVLHVRPFGTGTLLRHSLWCGLCFL